MVVDVMEAIKKLKDTDTNILLFLPPSEVVSDKGGVVITVWHDQLADKSHRFVVQRCKKRFWGLFNNVSAEGFLVKEDGSKVDLKPEELYDFL